MKLRLKIAGVTLMGLLGACASNGYKDFYQPANGVTSEVIASTRAAPAPPSPSVDRTRSVDVDVIKAYARNGYVAVGQSAFNSGKAAPESDAIAQAKTVGADIVLIIDPHYTGSITTSIPLVLPNTTTSQTTSTATAFGPGGSATAYGNATTTTNGSQTLYIPRTINRSDYGAIYFVKKKLTLGAWFSDLSDAQRQALQSNKGVVIDLVVNGGAAFTADLLAGDIVVAVDGTTVTGSAGLAGTIAANAGQTVTFSIVRNGQQLSKLVSLGIPR